MEYSITNVTRDNYHMHDDMLFFRKNGRERTEDERKIARDFAADCRTLGNENLFIYAAQVGDAFVGYISIAYIPKVGQNLHGYNGFLFIDELWTNPNYRKNGIARALMKKADALCQEKGISGLRLYVGDTNRDAMALYAKCGYEDLGGDAHFMQKKL